MSLSVRSCCDDCADVSLMMPSDCCWPKNETTTLIWVEVTPPPGFVAPPLLPVNAGSQGTE